MVPSGRCYYDTFPNYAIIIPIRLILRDVEVFQKSTRPRWHPFPSGHRGLSGSRSSGVDRLKRGGTPSLDVPPYLFVRNEISRETNLA